MSKTLGLIVVTLLLLQGNPAAAQSFPSFADLVEKLQPTVVNISTAHSPENTDVNESLSGIESTNPKVSDYFNAPVTGQLSLGSGFIIDKNGYIITNNHVIDGAREITVTLSDNRQLEARLIGRDNKTDIALIKVESATELPAVTLGDSDKIRVGDWVLAIGNPFGLGGSVTAGIVSAKSRDIEAGPYDNFIQTDASINQGSSGGPMFNMSGEVIGINTAIFSTNGGSMGIGFAVPINLTHFVIEQLKQNGKVERGWIGLKIQPNSADISDSLGQTGKNGIVVSSVSDNSSAKSAGIEAGDIILSLNGAEVNDTKSFSRIIAETKPDTQINLEIWRNRQKLPKTMAVQKMPEEIEKPQKTEQNSHDKTSPGEITALQMTIADLTPDIVTKYGFAPETTGVVVTDILSGSDAEIKGVRPGNLITQIDKKTVFDSNDFRTYVEEAKLENNRPVLLLINDNNVPHYAAVKLKTDE